MSDLTHLVIGRAAGPDADNESVEARLAFDKNPSKEDLEKIRDALRDQFEAVFDYSPPRTAVVVLPYVTSLDDDEQDDGLDVVFLNNAPFQEPLDDDRWDAGWPPQ